MCLTDMAQTLTKLQLCKSPLRTSPPSLLTEKLDIDATRGTRRTRTERRHSFISNSALPHRPMPSASFFSAGFFLRREVVLGFYSVAETVCVNKY